jgi:CelD/BcsL family acetyltransferase involved in cellulose biosynthesis
MSLDTEPACPEAAEARSGSQAAAAGLILERRRLGSIEPATWDRLAAASPWATPFSSWAFHRAWWDAYADNAHEETAVLLDPAAGSGSDPVAIVPLMHRHEVEPTDEARHTTLRHGGDSGLTPVPASATAIFFGASYHADYATILTDPSRLPAVAEALVADLRSRAASATPDWDVVDLRRLRCGDPAAEALAEAARGANRPEATATGWTVDLEREDVCPVAELPAGGSIDDFLGSLGKKERHEIRRKVRRAEAAGEVVLVESDDPLRDLDAFIDLHQARWGADGLFPPTTGGDQSRVFIRRLFELFGGRGTGASDGGPGSRGGASGPQLGSLHLCFLTVGGRRIAAGVHFETSDRLYYYNAGTDPDARELSPGVVMIERYMRRAIDRGLRAVDFMRGDEPYKYEWGAVDQPIQRLLISRTVAR